MSRLGDLAARALRWLGPRNAVDSSAIRRGDGIWESFTGETGGAPSERAALGVSAAYACICLISGAIASMPMHVYRRSADGDRTRDPQHDLWWVLNEEFAPRWSAAAGWSFITASKLLHGDGYAEILRRGPKIVGLTPLHPDRVRPVASPDGDRLVYEIQPDRTIERPSARAASIRVLDQDDVLHVPGFGFDGLRGLSPLRVALRTSGRLAISAQEFSAKFLENMARPDFALKTDANLSAEQVERLRGILDSHKGPAAGGRPMILEGGLSIEPLTMPLAELQLLETRRFAVEEIARIYGVPPFMIGHTDKTTSWGSGVEQMGVGFVRFTLRDHLTAFHNEINRKFFRSSRWVAEFDTTELERADTKSLFSALRIAVGRAGEPQIMSVAEVRERLNLSRVAEGLGINPGTPADAPAEPADRPAREDDDEEEAR